MLPLELTCLSLPPFQLHVVITFTLTLLQNLGSAKVINERFSSSVSASDKRPVPRDARQPGTQ